MSYKVEMLSEQQSNGVSLGGMEIFTPQQVEKYGDI